MQVKDARVAFGGVRALDGVSLTVQDGQLLGLIGPNGSGKSTLLAAISRMIDLSSGTLTMEGRDYTNAPAHLANALGIARTFQTVRLLRTMSVLENVMLGAQAEWVRRGPLATWLWLSRARREEKRARRAAQQALERVGLKDLGRRHPQELPYGPARKVEIARALACEPKLLLLDEPTAGMSQAEREEVGILLSELSKDGLAQVLVEHDLAMIQRVCNRVVALNFGQVIAEGLPAQVAADELVREAYLGHRDAGMEASAPMMEIGRQ